MTNIPSSISIRLSGFDSYDYCSPEVFEADKMLLAKQWNYVDHLSNFTKIGDYRVHKVCGESIIVVKAPTGMKAFVNVCRHRGSLICLNHSGNADKFECPYHGWQYNLDGKIRRAIAAPGVEQIPEEFSLISVGIHVYEGLIFVALDSANAPLFNESANVITQLIAWHGLQNTKIASAKNYLFKANWKLVVENFLECFHCWSNHPELTSVYHHPKLTGSTSPKANSEFIMEFADWERATRAMGHPTGGCSSIDTNAEQFAVAFRMPIGGDRKSLSKDGEPIAPLIGKFKQFDGGETFGYFGPLLHFSLLNDHAMLIRIDPEAPTLTNVQLYWFVNKTAEEGKDYDKAKLIWLWDTTVKQDRTAVQRSQLGYESQFDRRGFYSELEQESAKFAQWYRNRISE